MTKISEHLPPTPGLFSTMPQDIWGPTVDASYVDIELWTRIGEMSASPLFRYYVKDGTLDTPALAAMLYHRFHENWQRIWDALHMLYTIDETKSSEQIREITRTLKGLETRDLANVSKEIRDLVRAAQETSTRTGSVARSGTDTETVDLTDAETRNLTGSAADSGTERLTDTFNESTATNSTLARAGSETTTGSDTETRNLSGTATESGTDRKTETRNLTGSTAESGTERLTDTFNESNSSNETVTKSGTETVTGHDNETRNLSEKDSGTVGTTGTTTHKGTGHNQTLTEVFGVGGTAVVPSEQQNNSDEPNYVDTSDSTETRNLTKSDTGTSNHETSQVTSFTGRSDATTGGGTHTGTVDHATTFGKSTATTDKGTVDNSTVYGKGTDTTDTGTVKNDTTSSLNYVNRTDTTSGTDTHTGTVEHATTFGKSTATTDKGTVSTVRTGTNEHARSESETYNNVADSRTGTDTDKGTVTSDGAETGTVANDLTETTRDHYTERGSSALGSFQDAINDELNGRRGHGWNFINIVIDDVQSMIALKVWGRSNDYWFTY